MPNMTIPLSPELKKKMDAFPIVNWSAVARKAFEQQIADMELINRLRKRSTLTEEDAIRLGREVNNKIAIKLGLKK